MSDIISEIARLTLFRVMDWICNRVCLALLMNELDGKGMPVNSVRRWLWKLSRLFELWSSVFEF